jgi:uncharacterized membrane protein
MRNNIMWLVIVGVVAFGLLLPPKGSAFSLFSRHAAVRESNGEIRLALDEVSDGKAHYYAYEDGGKTIKFFVVKSRDGVVRAAFDACDVCFPEKKGYRQEGDFMVCINCGRKFHTTQVNVVEGGCNPAPLAREVVGDQLMIKVADIRLGGRFF